MTGGCFDTPLLKFWDSIKVFFVVRVKENLLYERIEERDLPDKAHPEVLIDEIVRLTGNETAEQYAKPIRRIAVYNALHHFTMVLLTNNMTLAAGTIADLYKARWDIEIFFRNRWAELPHQELCRNLTQCGGGTDMDGAHHHTAFCRAQAAGNLQMALLEPRLVAQAQHFYENRPLSMDKRAVHTSARD